jgi:NAD(P)-dependent dehydrogenase (short-subunit alcohol dehydrogenase family)
MTKKLFISAGNRGIGLEFVRQYLSDGWQVFATAREPEEADELTELREQNPERLKILKLDVTIPEAIEAVGRTMERLTEGLDLLINNAGTYGARKKFTELNAGDIEDVFDTNCLGAFRLTRQLFSLVENNGGDIIFITSLMGSIDDNRSGGAYPYRISKAALNMLGKTIAEDYKDRSVNTLMLHPGWVETRLGGPNAKISTEESVSGMRQVIGKLDQEMSGGFYAYDGKTRPW